MKTDRLRNLLVELDDRLRRIEKSLVEQDVNQLYATSILKGLRALRGDVRRQIGSLNSLNRETVNSIERQIDELRSAVSSENYDRGSTQFSLFEAIFTDKFGLLNLTAGMKIGLNLLGPDEVLDLVPGQKTAAFQFEFRGDRLVVVDQTPQPMAREREIAEAALEASINHAAEVASDLEKSNCSPRLKEAFSRLQQSLQTHKNIVQVGQIANICNRLIQANLEELSLTQFGLLTGHIEMVFSALAQFEDWRIFSDNAAMVQIDHDSIVKLTEGARETLRHLRESENVDRSVTDALQIATGWVEDTDKVEKRDVLSLARTLENIWSAVCKIVLAVSKETTSEARKFVARGIISVALLNGAAFFVPALDAVPGAGWIKTVYSYFTTGKGAPSGPNS